MILNESPKDTSPLIPKHSKKQITAIQGLRAVAILAVLLFHIRDDIFPVGYFGVDIFFVISGYLMCMLMSRKLPLNRPKVSDFYFRRLKRIVPTYLFVIFCVHSSAILIWLYPLDYQDLFEETIKSLFFAANVPGDDNANYFAQSAGSFKLFTHLWSLAAEIQFYIFVPLLIFIFGHFHTFPRILLVLSLGCMSCLFQLNATKDTEHMHLFSRTWQFMSGFFAHYIEESRVLEAEYWLGLNGKKCTKFLSRSLNLIVTVALIFLVSVYVWNKQTTRFVVIFLTTLIIARPDFNLILCNPLLVFLGDISYSVYMIHWPIFECYKYLNVTSYAYKQKTSYCVAFFLIIASILVGYLIEKAYNKCNDYIRSWKSLIAITFVFYLCIFGSMCYLDENAENEEAILSKLPKDLTTNFQVNKDLLGIWRNQDNRTQMDKRLSMAYNNRFKELGWGLWTCSDRRQDTVPTSYDIRPMDITATCHLKGAGSKTIVVLGNSHARTVFHGIEYHFHYLYKDITLLANHQCGLVRLKDKAKHMTKEKYNKCQLFLNDIIKMLKSWESPIDIIIVQHAYILPYDPPIANDINQDVTYKEIQSLYSSLAEVAREVVFVPVGHFETGVNPHLKILQRRILYDQDLGVFRTPISYNQKQWPNLKQRIRQVNCSKCVLIEWETLWCDQTQQACDTIDFERKISYFADSNHHNAYGGLKVGHFIRTLYEKWRQNQPDKPMKINDNVVGF